MLRSVGAIPHYSRGIRQEGFPAPVSDMAARFAAADAVVIATPKFDYSIPRSLKKALDWRSRFDLQRVAGKPVAIQTGSPGAIGGARALWNLRQLLAFLDAATLDEAEVMSGQMYAKVAAPEGPVTDATTADILRAQSEAFGSDTPSWLGCFGPRSGVGSVPSGS